MGSATREQWLAAIAGLLGVGAAMCNREQETSVVPVHAREVPSVAPDPSASSAAANDDSIQGEAADAIVAPDDAGTSVAAIPDAASTPPPPIPPQPRPTSLAAFERFAPPPPRPAGPRPPTPPPQHCCSTGPSCGVRSCPGMDLSQPLPPQLGVSAAIGLKVKTGVDDAVAASARRWIQYARSVLVPCAKTSMGLDARGGTLNVEIHAGDGGVGVSFSVVSATVPAKVAECVVARLGQLRAMIVVDGPPPKLVFPIVMSAQWVLPSNGLNGIGQP